MAEGKKKKRNLWNFIDTLEGDKVVWMIVLILILFSIVAIFSSTPLLAVKMKTSRMAIVKEQLIISVVGLALITLCYNIKSIGFFRVVSQFGYFVSIFLLGILVSHKSFGPVKPLFLNNAWRIVSVAGVQVHVFEVVKVAMVMYLAWAINAFTYDKFLVANLLSKKYPVFSKPLTKKIIYIYIPIFSVCLCIMAGSLSSTLFIGGIMFLTILIGGIKVKELFIPGAVAVALLFVCIGINNASDKPAKEKPFPHLETALNRIKQHGEDNSFEILKTAPHSSEEFQNTLDLLKQPVSAKIAINQGGLFGKGPGRSTQRYVVPIMFEDYMFSFLVEEYGLIIGGILVIMLYLSLLARGSIIVRNCDRPFPKVAVAGLILLITGQAMMHIMVNCDIGPLTGQTLPMISHGNSSFLMFSLAFGIILSISRMAKKKIDREAEQARPLTDKPVRSEMESTIQDLEDMESGFPEHENDIPDYGLDDHNNE